MGGTCSQQDAAGPAQPALRGVPAAPSAAADQATAMLLMRVPEADGTPSSPWCLCADDGKVLTWGLNMCGRPSELAAVVGAFQRGDQWPDLRLHRAAQARSLHRCAQTRHGRACTCLQSALAAVLGSRRLWSVTDRADSPSSLRRGPMLQVTGGGLEAEHIVALDAGYVHWVALTQRAPRPAQPHAQLCWLPAPWRLHQHAQLLLHAHRLCRVPGGPAAHACTPNPRPGLVVLVSQPVHRCRLPAGWACRPMPKSRLRHGRMRRRRRVHVRHGL